VKKCVSDFLDGCTGKGSLGRDHICLLRLVLAVFRVMVSSNLILLGNPNREHGRLVFFKIPLVEDHYVMPRVISLPDD